MVNSTLLNFGKRYDDNLRLKLHLGLDLLSNQKILKVIYYLGIAQLATEE